MSKRVQKQKDWGKGSQIDIMRTVRKEMPPPTRVIRLKNRPKPSNWKEYLDEDYEDYEDDYDINY